MIVRGVVRACKDWMKNNNIDVTKTNNLHDKKYTIFFKY